MKIINIVSGNHNIKLYTNGVQKPNKIILCMHGFNGDLWGDGFSKLKKLLLNENNIMICSFDSAGHGESEVKSIDVTLDLVVQEISSVVNYIVKTYKNIPLYFYAFSYGGYRAMVSISKNVYAHLDGIILVNPAINMIEVLEKLKHFNYKELNNNSVISMKSSENKFLSKKFLDDLYENNLFNITYKMNIPIKLLIGKNDSLISKHDLKRFADFFNCDYEYLDDDHCIKNDTSWERIAKIIREL